MQKQKKIVLFMTVFVATLMVLSSLVILAQLPGQSSGNATTANTASTVNTALSDKGTQILSNLQSKGIPTSDIYMPSFKKAPVSAAGITGPSYTSAPAPMGIGTYGISNNSGVLTRYNLSTSSFSGAVTFNNMTTFYPYGDAPNSVTVQLNSILNNVTLFGKSDYTFWNQNVLFYSARTNSVQFLDNIWNFSSSAFYMSPNVFSSYQGNLVAPQFYYAVGPAFSVTYPFTVNFYLNSTVLNGENTVFFNYTLKDSTGAVSGSFDEVQFNSTYGMPAGYSAPQANYFVTSNNVTPTGFIPYDSEIMIGGPGGGSTAMVYNINATMTLKYKNAANKYVNVPSAYDVGSETGETSTGVAVTWGPNAVAHLSAGPSFVYGMWNVSQTNALNHYTGNVNPPNSFMFVSQGPQFNASTAVWSPLSQSGGYSFSLPAGDYSYAMLMSNRNPESGMMVPGSTQNIHLSKNYAMGVYTPLYAFGNSQLKYISAYGHGTHWSPYVLFNNPSPNGMLNQLFSSMNDYFFPDFSGVLLHGTTANVVVHHMPSLTVQYTASWQAILASYGGIYYGTNQLGYVLYNAQNVVMTGNSVSGWFSNYLSTFPVANVLLWNSQHNMIVNNHFKTMDSSLLIYNTQTQKGHNWVVGNLFMQDQSLTNMTYPGIAIDTTFGTSVYGPVALTVYSSQNFISGNSFIVYNPVNSPFYSIYSGYGATYTNFWNHNFWWNYVPHSGMYNNNGLIANGGDHHPITFRHYSPSMLEPLVTNFMYS